TCAPGFALVSLANPAATSFVAIFWAAAPRRSYDAVIFALRGGAEHDELRVGEFDGHGLSLRLWEHGQSGPSPGRAPDRCDRRGEGVSASHSRPRGRPHTRSLSKETPVLSTRWRSHLEER